MKQNTYKSKNEINKIGITEDTLTGRGGLIFFVKYLKSINIYAVMEKGFEKIRKSKKGLPIWKLFKQIFCWLYDGTSRSVSYFDQLKTDEGYGVIIENGKEEMASSHQIKRFFKAFSKVCSSTFRKILRELFVWRLKINKPEVIYLTLDTMVMNNNEAKKREGVEASYKKVKGFQPLQILWEGKIIDGIFRGGKKHGNSGKTVINMIKVVVNLIRKRYSKTVSIIVRMDSGFFDGDNFKALNDMGVGFIATGKMYEEIKEYVSIQKADQWHIYDNGHQEWRYIEFGYKCKGWKQFYRTFYTQPKYEENQQLLEFARPDNVIITNIGVNPEILKDCGKETLVTAEAIIENHHQRGADELPHRGLKDFSFEELPFEKFAMNTAFYYCMLIAFFLFETMKEDVLVEVIPISSYATTVRRVLLDFAAKIVKTGHQIILKVNQRVMEHLHFRRLWTLCHNPIPIIA